MRRLGVGMLRNGKRVAQGEAVKKVPQRKVAAAHMRVVTLRQGVEKGCLNIHAPAVFDRFWRSQQVQISPILTSERLFD